MDAFFLAIFSIIPRVEGLSARFVASLAGDACIIVFMMRGVGFLANLVAHKKHVDGVVEFVSQPHVGATLGIAGVIIGALVWMVWISTEGRR